MKNNYDFDKLHAPELVKREENAAFLKNIELGERKKFDESKEWGRVLGEKYVMRWRAGEKHFQILTPSAVSLNGRKCVRIFNETLIENINERLLKHKFVLDEDAFCDGRFEVLPLKEQ